jgi:hypothetical protein
MTRFVSRNGRQVISSRKQFERLNDLAYGIWECEDRRVVLFNRFYEPIWEFYPDGPLKPADSAEWVPFVKQDWFYGDKDSEKQKIRKSEAALAAIMAGKVPVTVGA